MTQQDTRKLCTKFSVYMKYKESKLIHKFHTLGQHKVILKLNKRFMDYGTLILVHTLFPINNNKTVFTYKPQKLYNEIINYK